MGEPCGWTITSCGCNSKCWDSFSPATRTMASAMASFHAWAATGRRYGLCDIVVQPCNPWLRGTDYRVYPAIYEWGVGHDGMGLVAPYIDVGGDWRNAAACGAGCTCAPRRQPCEVHLEGPTTKDRISAVTVHGEVVAPSAYVLFDNYKLLRIDGECWPTCTNPLQQDPPAFTVAYSRGDPIPAAVLSAAQILTCQYGKLCQTGTCALPSRVTSITRQGVEVEVEAPSDNWEDLIRTGIPAVDAIFASDNPGRRRERPLVVSPDLPPPRMLT